MCRSDRCSQTRVLSASEPTNEDDATAFASSSNAVKCPACSTSSNRRQQKAQVLCLSPVYPGQEWQTISGSGSSITSKARQPLEANLSHCVQNVGHAKL